MAMCFTNLKTTQVKIHRKPLHLKNEQVLLAQQRKEESSRNNIAGYSNSDALRSKCLACEENFQDQDMIVELFVPACEEGLTSAAPDC